MNDVNPSDEHDVTDAKRAELLLDHYHDTFEHILYHWKARNRLFMLILVLLAAISVDLYQPRFASDLVNAYLQKELDGAQGIPTIELRVVGCVVWLLLLSLVVNYYQRSIHVDRQYNYIAGVEDDLNRLLGQRLITREGRAYLSREGVAGKELNIDQRPWFLKGIGCVYTIIFPLGLIALAGWRLASEWMSRATSSWPFVVVNILVALGLFAYNALYLCWRLSKR